MSVRRYWALLIVCATALMAGLLMYRKSIAGSEPLRYLAIALLALLFALACGGFTRLGPMRLHPRHDIRDFGVGCAVGASLAGVSILLYCAVHDAGTSWDRLNLRDGWKFVVLAAGAGFAEEVLFRGLLLGCLLRLSAQRALVANVVQALLFAALHSNVFDFSIPYRFFELVAVGLLLGRLALANGSLWMGMGLHFAFNLSSYLFFGVHKRLLAPLNGLHLGYQDGLLMSKITLGVSCVFLAASWLCIRRGKSGS